MRVGTRGCGPECREEKIVDTVSSGVHPVRSTGPFVVRCLARRGAPTGADGAFVVPAPTPRRWSGWA